MNKDQVVKASVGTPVALCYACAKEYAEAYTLRKIPGGMEHKITCEGCRKRGFGAEYEIGGRGK